MISDSSTEKPAPPAGPERSLTVTWEDPFTGVAVLPTMSGMDFLGAMIDGRLPPPPITNLMGMRLVAIEPGSATFVCNPHESQYNPIGTVHGGLVCTLLDSAVGCAVHTTLPMGQGYTSLEIKVNYLRPVRSETGELTCVGTVTKPGSRVAFAEGVVTDAAGKVVATASSTLLVFPV
jgi:uncharacterized protein (TIGR00369 family)